MTDFEINRNNINIEKSIQNLNQFLTSGNRDRETLCVKKDENGNYTIQKLNKSDINVVNLIARFFGTGNLKDTHISLKSIARVLSTLKDEEFSKVNALGMNTLVDCYDNVKDKELKLSLGAKMLTMEEQYKKKHPSEAAKPISQDPIQQATETKKDKPLEPGNENIKKTPSEAAKPISPGLTTATETEKDKPLEPGIALPLQNIAAEKNIEESPPKKLTDEVDRLFPKLDKNDIDYSRKLKENSQNLVQFLKDEREAEVKLIEQRKEMELEGKGVWNDPVIDRKDVVTKAFKHLVDRTKIPRENATKIPRSLVVSDLDDAGIESLKAIADACKDAEFIHSTLTNVIFEEFAYRYSAKKFGIKF